MSRLFKVYTKEVAMATQTNLSIDPRRLWDSIQDTARFGGTPKGGVRRLACTGEDKLVRDWFRAECEAIGCNVAIDRCGNMFATFPGRNPALPPIATGSHLDTQPTGGKYDGILGVLAGLEVIRTFAETGYQTNAPLMVVNWTNEEGSRFPPAMQCSGVYAGAFALDDALATPDRAGVTLGQALDLIGYAGAESVRVDRFQAMFELHIEQGPILEAEEMTIGAVLGVQGIRWHEVTLHGQDAHTGATPMKLRRDALCGMAAVVTATTTRRDRGAVARPSRSAPRRLCCRRDRCCWRRRSATQSGASAAADWRRASLAKPEFFLKILRRQYQQRAF